jgi:hypothetical protein
MGVEALNYRQEDVLKERFAQDRPLHGQQFDDHVSKCGMVAKAQRESKQILVRSAFSWASLISGSPQENSSFAKLILFYFLFKKAIIHRLWW